VISGHHRRLGDHFGRGPRGNAQWVQSGVDFITTRIPAYPPAVEGDSPIADRVVSQGDATIRATGIAIVGSRRTSSYGQGVAKTRAELARLGFCIVQRGLARRTTRGPRGGALVGGKTAAVLGTGIDIVLSAGKPCSSIAGSRKTARS